MRTVCKFLIIILITELMTGPVLAQQIKFGAPAAESSSGLSFRKGGLGGGGGGAGGGSATEAMTRGMLVTDPGMSGLVYQVHVLGEVKSPGTYRITASDRLSEVLQRAGGADDQGSQRNIEVRRAGEGVLKVDLLKFQVFGSLADNPYLLDNDVVYVPLKKDTVEVVGAVKRPREYELRNEKTLKDVIVLAGGVSTGVAIGSPIRVVRFVEGKKNVLEVSDNDDALRSFRVNNGDVIFVPHMITEKNKFDYNVPKLPGDNIFYPSYEDRVFVLGGVAMPGAYPFNPYYKLSQYLSLAGGTTQLATRKVSLLSPEGKKHRLKNKEKDIVVINPGDTILVDQRRIPPEGWVGIFMSIAGFGLSTTATVLTLTR